MAEKDIFKDQKKLRKAKIFTPPNIIKGKVGSGGIDPAALVAAQQALENNTVDFKPIGVALLKDLNTSIEDAKKSELKDEAVIEAMLYPAAQFKAQGSVFRFPLVSDISDILINFLETVTTPVSEDAMEIITAHKMALTAIIHGNMSGPDQPQGPELKQSLSEACIRYYKKRNP